VALLYVDLLGTQARFDRGITIAREGIRALEELVRATLAASELDEDEVRGATETDSLALQFDRAGDAIAFGIDLFQRGFATEMASGDPLWLRGIIVRSSLALHPRRVLDAQWPEVQRVWSSPAFLRAAILEKSGYRGMRLLVEHSLVRHLRERFAIRLHDTVESRFRRLDSVPDARRVADEFHEVLWMWTPNRATWAQRRRLLARRVRHATDDPHERAQAKGTEAVFDRCDELRRRAERRTRG
jgi:hypothetical protein